MRAPPIGLGYCETCKYYDLDKGLCRLLAPGTSHDGRWPRCLPTDWCGQWDSPTALPRDITLAPASVARLSGVVTIAVSSGLTGVFLEGDIVRVNGVAQPTTVVSGAEVTFPFDTAQAVGEYVVRVGRPSDGRVSGPAVLHIT